MSRIRIVEYSVQSNHVHLVVEASDQRELSRGMQGFGIRLAKNLNAASRPQRVPASRMPRAKAAAPIARAGLQQFD